MPYSKNGFKDKNTKRVQVSKCPALEQRIFEIKFQTEAYVYMLLVWNLIEIIYKYKLNRVLLFTLH